MAEEPQIKNPYDFRSPVSRSALLAGRDDEMEAIDDLLRDSSADSPTHLSLFGGQGSGKSSLLNGAVDLACARGMMVVKLALTSTIVETEIDFYRALYDAALQTLIDTGRLTTEDELMGTWALRTYTGVAPASQQEITPGELQFGLLIAAKLNGRMVESVPTPMLRRDIELLLSVGCGPMRRLVLCLDSAELLDDNHDLGPSLTHLADSCSFLTIITAAETAGTLQAAAPRAWAQIEVGPYRGVGAVIDAITKPATNADGIPEITPPTPETARDIADLTGRVPYEVNLVSHFIWDAIQQGEQDSFELSPSVIQRVTVELEEKGRHQASPEIATYSNLSQADYTMLGRYAPYEALSLRELALLRLMLEDHNEDDLAQAETQVRNELAQLELKGVVILERDRFAIKGSRDARLYLKYAAKRHTGDDLHYGDTYTWAVTMRFANQLGAAVGDDDDYGKALIFRGGRPQELGDDNAGSWAESIGSAAARGDIVALSEPFGLSLPTERMTGPDQSSFLLSVVQLQVGVYDVEYVELVVSGDGSSAEEALDTGNNWLAREEDLLGKYGIRVVDRHCFEIPRETLRAVIAYGHLRLACGVSYPVFRTGARSAAEGLLGTVLEIATEMVGSDPQDPLIRTELANALSRQAFIASHRGNWDAAIDGFQSSRRMFLTEEWLLDYNEAYVRARQGDLDLACSLGALAVAHHETGIVELVLLHAYFPTPDDWATTDERWNLIELRGTWITRFLNLQLLVLKAIATGGEREELASAVAALGTAAPPPLLRLGGWATITLLNDAPTAAMLFGRAVAGTRYDETDMPAQEATYAERRAEGPVPAP
jgi:hypothetical protein